MSADPYRVRILDYVRHVWAVRHAQAIGNDGCRAAIGRRVTERGGSYVVVGY